ncbi:MAG TPA: hypothetical protein VM283_05805, partial [Armatimonadota bacterium]|nr:hypothetical protein [Armatimonadota bacterium]
MRAMIICLCGLCAAAHADTVLTVTTRDAQAQAWLNGEPLPEGGGELALGTGLNLLAIEATAAGGEPRVSAQVSADGRALDGAWLSTAQAPAEGWRAALPGEGWAAAVADAAGMWPAAGAQAAWFVRGLYVGEPGPQLFPKLDTFYIPRGSRQLMRFYVHAPLDVPADDYAMMVEAPASLRYVAVEPVSGGSPQVERVAEFREGETDMARYRVGYDLIPRQGLELSMRWGDATDHTLTYEPTIAAGGSFDWRHLSMTITPPAGAVSAHPLIIKWQSRGITGTFWVDNLVLREEGSDQNLLQM